MSVSTRHQTKRGRSISPTSRRSSCAGIRTIAATGTTRSHLRHPPEREGWPGIGVWPSSFDPDLTASDAPALWRADAAASVVALDRAPPGFAGVCALAGIGVPAACGEDAAGRHLVYETITARHRLWLRTPDDDAPLVILLKLTADPIAADAADAARRFLSGAPLAAGSAALHPSRFQRQRLALLLRVLDADLAGASNRQIGSGILYPWLAELPADSWKSSSERRRTQRLIAEARHMMRAGYRDLLAGR